MLAREPAVATNALSACWAPTKRDHIATKRPHLAILLLQIRHLSLELLPNLLGNRLAVNQL